MHPQSLIAWKSFPFFQSFSYVIVLHIFHLLFFLVSYCIIMFGHVAANKKNTYFISFFLDLLFLKKCKIIVCRCIRRKRNKQQGRQPWMVWQVWRGGELGFRLPGYQEHFTLHYYNAREEDMDVKLNPVKRVHTY